MKAKEPPFWIDPTALNGPAAAPGISWDGCLPAGCEVIAAYVTFAVGAAGSGSATNHPLYRLEMPVALNDGFGAVFYTHRLKIICSPSADLNFTFGFGGFTLTRPFELTPQDMRIDMVAVLPGALKNYPGGPGPYQWVVSGQQIGGNTFTKGSALLVRRVA